MSLGVAMRFTWDSNKNRRNKRVHGIDFGDAARIFEGSTLEVLDDREDYGETRILAFGQIGNTIVAVVYTDRNDDERRIISARKARAHEVRAYYEAIHGKGW
jgi:uncharacterized DUF497 family protein